jgi:hypothetical protein
MSILRVPFPGTIRREELGVQTLERSNVEFYLGVVITIFSAVLPMTWWLRCLFLLVVAGIIIDVVYRSPLTINWSFKKKAFLALLGMVLVTAIGWRPIRDDYIGTELPDVALQFVYPNSPMLRILNISNVTARQIKFTVAVWDIDKPQEKNPLQIPVQTFDFIRPHLFGGNEGVFEPLVRSGIIKPGTRLFGSASAECPDCRKGHIYWLYIIWGQSGWYSEIPNVTAAGIMFPKDFQNITATEFAERTIPLIPETQRVPIEKPNE